MNNQPCNFFKSREKEQKLVFIAAPSKRLKDLRKEIVSLIEDVEHYDCYFAADRATSSNKISLCQKICEPMLKSVIVVIIGDWKSNRGNVNVAFEYGLATAFGCAVIPVELEHQGKGAFDFLPLEKVIVSKKWEEDEKELEKFRKEFLERFRNERDKVEFSNLSRELSPQARLSIKQLVEHWETAETDQERESCQRQLLKYHQSNPISQAQIWQETNIVRHVVSSLKRYSDEGFSDQSMRMLFFQIMEATITNNLSSSRNPIVSDPHFLDALKNIAASTNAPLYARATSLDCLAMMVTNSGLTNLLDVFSQIIDNENDQMYDQLSIPKRITDMAGNMFRAGTIGELLKMVRNPKKSPARTITKRYEQIVSALGSK